MNLIFLIAILFVLYKITISINKNNNIDLILYTLCLILISPMIQYLTYPEYKNMNEIRVLNLERIWPELLIIGIEVGIILAQFHRNKFINKSTTFSVILTLFLISNLFQFITTVDLERSFYGYMISVIKPVAFGIITFKSFCDLKKINIAEIINLIIRFSLINISILLTFIFFNIIRGAINIDEINFIQYDGLGIFRIRIIFTILTFFFPLIFINIDYHLKEINKKYFFLFRILMIVLLVISGSRTMYMSSLIMGVILIIFNPFNNRKTIIKTIIFLTVVLGVIQLFSNSDVLDIISSRFTNKGGTIISSAINDERFLIWEFAKRMYRESNYMGIGIGNFTLLHPKHYANAHSLFYSILAERGIFSLIFFILLIMTILANLVISARKTKALIKNFYFSLIAGVLFYLAISITGEELLSISQVVYSIVPHMILFIFTISLISRKIFYNEA